MNSLDDRKTKITVVLGLNVQMMTEMNKSDIYIEKVEKTLREE